MSTFTYFLRQAKESGRLSQENFDKLRLKMGEVIHSHIPREQLLDLTKANRAVRRQAFHQGLELLKEINLDLYSEFIRENDIEKGRGR